MIIIGICDDEENEIDKIEELCKEYLVRDEAWNIIRFTSGEDLLRYADDKSNLRIDLLFLDIEMKGISGIQVKEEVLNCDNVWRIVFVSSYRDRVLEGFGLKTLGYIEKPATLDNVSKRIEEVINQLTEEVFLDVRELGPDIPDDLRIDEVRYIRADGSYSEIHTSRDNNGEDYYLVTKKIGKIEELLKGYPFVRVHRTYMVNLMHIKEIDTKITNIFSPHGI